MKCCLTIACVILMSLLASAQNTAPTISAISGVGVDAGGNLTMTEDDDVTVNFTVADAQTAAGSLTVSGTRTNSVLFPSIGTSSTSRLRLAVVSGGSRSLRVRPAANLHGQSNVTLTVTDAGGLSASITFSITVTSVYDPPLVRADNFLAKQNRSTTLDVLRNDTAGAEAGQTFSLTSFTQPTQGSLVQLAGSSLLFYTPGNGFTGADSFTYTVTDNTGVTASASALITVGHYLPLDLPHTDIRVNYGSGKWSTFVLTDLPFGTPNQGGLNNPTQLDYDDALLLVNSQSHLILPGSLNPVTFSFLGRGPGESIYLLPQSQNPNLLWPGFNTESLAPGTFSSYLPTGDPRATTTAVWLRCELVACRMPANAVFSLYQSGSSPVVWWDTLDGINGSNETAHGNNVSDTFWINSGTHAHMNWSFTHVGRYELDVRWKAFVNVSGTLTEVSSPVSTLHFMVYDSASAPSTGALTEAPPTVQGEAFSLSSYAGATTFQVLENDHSSPDIHEQLHLSSVTQGSKGSVAIHANGRDVIYTPVPGSVGTDTFTYTVEDEHGGAKIATVDITFLAVNQMPSFVKGIDKAHPPGFTQPQSLPMWASLIDDGDPGVVQSLTFQVTVQSGAALFSTPPTVSADGTLNYTLTGQPGTSQVSLTLTDDASAGGPELTTAPQTFSISVEVIAGWRQTYFGTSDNHGSAHDLADADGDGLSNLLEYALGLHPHQVSPPPAAQVVSGQLGFVFTPPPSVSGITYQAEWSSTLLPGSWADLPDTGVPPERRFMIPMTGQERRFLRLKISR
jgi:surface-anchored protein